MAQQEGYSPSFKRPADILRIRRKRAQSEKTGTDGRVAGCSPRASEARVRPFSPGPLIGAPSRSGGGVKRRNPFASIENTKRQATLSPGDGPEWREFTRVDGPSVLRTEPLTQPEKDDQEGDEPRSFYGTDSAFDDDLFSADGRPTLAYPSGEEPGASEATPPALCAEYPADWSLKTRLLFTSPLTFSWTEHLKAQEEAQGFTQHCRAAHSTLPSQIQEPRTSTELRCAFLQCLVYWQHPSLPWVPLFPRIGAERRFSEKSMPWAQDEDVQQRLMSDWSLSVTSLYSLLRARLCPFFYLCTYQFTVLFRAAGMSGTSGITALLSPTTRGLREAMRAEGIEFTLPWLEERKRSREGLEDKKQGEAEEEEEDDDDDDDEASFSWLKQMGVQDQIKKPDSIFIKLRKENAEVQLDHRPQSVVLVKGPHTFTLLNFLINCKALVAASGVQAGLPPTLLAPVAFRGATLHTLKARCVNVKTQVRTGYRDVFSLEVTGPVMPHALHSLTQLLRVAQRGCFSVGLYTHEPTAVLNTPVAPHQAEKQEEVAISLGACGLAPSTAEQLFGGAHLGKSALRQLHMDEYSYTWRT